SKEDHEVHLKLVLELRKKEKLVAKFSKYEFWLQKVHFLRHVVNSNGIHVDPSKIEAVKNWKVPKTPSEIRSFLGLAGYYRCFIMNFSKIAKPLTSLTQKNQKYEWDKEQEGAFQTLKDNLCNAPILSLPDGSKDFVLYCDALNQGFGCVLMQRGKINYKEERKERVKPRRVRAMSMTIQSSVKDKILVAQGEASKVENATAKMLHDQDQQMEKKEDGGLCCIDRGWDSIDSYTRRLQDEKLARIYIDEIVARNGVPVSIISDCDGRFTSRFWQTLQKALRTRLDMSTAYHPQTDGQSDRTIQTIIRVFVTLRSKHCMEGNVGRPFYGLKLEKCLAGANLHVPLEKIKVDKTLRFVKEPVMIIDREIKKMKRSRISIVKVRWNSKRGPEFTWER
ncbi:putative reverse transcriptase domain-containing protein, partial [Tanacetum coccineum]